MRYQFTFRNTAADMLRISLIYTYRSLAGTVNIVFTLAAAVLMIVKLQAGEPLIGVLAAVAVLYFPCIQPVIIYRKCRKIVSRQTEDTKVSFAEDKVYIQVGAETQELQWSQIYAVQKLSGCVLLYTGKGHGLAVPNRALKDKREEFYHFALEQVQKEHKK